MQRQAHMLKHGADLHGELLFAVAAAPQADANALFRVRLHLGDAVQSATVRANRTVRPHDIFEVGEGGFFAVELGTRSEEHTSELQSLMRNSYAVYCLKK